MRRLLVQILYITEVILCASDSPPLSEEDTLKGNAFIYRKQLDAPFLTDIGCKT